MHTPPYQLHLSESESDIDQDKPCAESVLTGGETVDFMVDSTDFDEVIETTCGNETVTLLKAIATMVIIFLTTVLSYLIL